MNLENIPTYLKEHVSWCNFRYKERKGKKTIKNEASEWQVFKNTHETIISEDTFQTMKRIRDGNEKPWDRNTKKIEVIFNFIGEVHIPSNVKKA
nr:recombinase family protein [uncultured Mediterraneibacter sp.]